MNDMSPGGVHLRADLRINPEIDIPALQEVFRRDGHVRIERFLSSGAPDLYRHLCDSPDWIQLIKHDEGAHELALSKWTSPRSRQRARIERAMYERARDGFQYSYSALRIPPPGEPSHDLYLTALATFMRSPEVMGVLGAITGLDAPRFTDGQVTAYGPGDFLTGHDDDLAGSGRQAAFVLGLAPQWRPEWGGLLLFHEIGAVELSGVVPQFNTLNLFSIPRYHSVSMVMPAAPRRRFAVTGWLST
ncbi:2OG-Fe(II) oxygenase family protein [Novosphingobium sp.]|uniref:2OG-Fe(II) oxygenase n=1 Tax=Novosphingobium sp. TaxID=1874826 RepID=UPI0025E92C14|nr:2OG-Fe(II) oxygenase family protein [Novosphingobium sp.]